MEYVMVVVGLVSHFLKDIVRIRKEDGVMINPVEYFVKFPYQSVLAVLSAFSGTVIAYEMGELTMLTAFAVGYMANSVADTIGKRHSTFTR
jgi:hypothetical protein